MHCSKPKHKVIDVDYITAHHMDTSDVLIMFSWQTCQLFIVGISAGVSCTTVQALHVDRCDQCSFHIRCNNICNISF